MVPVRACSPGPEPRSDLSQPAPRICRDSRVQGPSEGRNARSHGCLAGLVARGEVQSAVSSNFPGLPAGWVGRARKPAGWGNTS